MASYTYDGLDRPVSMWRGGSTHFFMLDRLGSVLGLMDGSGATVATYRYDPWGNLLAETGSVGQPFRFTGREWDAESGLYFYRMRYYDPKVGRFISRDSSGVLGGLNLYAYVFNRPTNLTDPWGTVALAAPALAFPPALVALGIAAAVVATGYGLYKLGEYILNNQSNSDAGDSTKPTSGDGEAAPTDGTSACPIPGTKPGRPTKGRTKQFEKPGDINDANQDFDDLKPENVRPLPNGGRVGDLPGGQTVVVRPTSSDGRPTVEIQNGPNRIKVRYGD
jgi:RHS repeat-associated protein